MNESKDRYVRPSCIPADMGGSDDAVDERMGKVLELLDEAPLDSVETILDVGTGKGQVARHLARKGKKVTGTGLELESYDVDRATLRDSYGVELVECGVEEMPFPDASFDAVVMSHVLEHCPNVGLALSEIRRVLRDDGWLLMFVPPHEEIVCAGHVSVGWSLGQLAYVLLLNGFNTKDGHFIRYGYNLCAYVRKATSPLPPLRGDRGDIHILGERFPLPIRTPDGSNDSYRGDVYAIRWPEASAVYARAFSKSLHRRAAERLARCLPRPVRATLGRFLLRAGAVLKEDVGELINPDVLKG